MNKITIVFYKTSAQRSPVFEWVEKLDRAIKDIVEVRFTRLAKGNFGDCKRLANGKGIWEIRINHGPGYRVYFGKQGSEIVVLLVAGNKGSQNRDIATAKQYWTNYKDSDE